MKKLLLIFSILAGASASLWSQTVVTQYPETDGMVNKQVRLNNKIYLAGSFGYAGKTTGSLAGYSTSSIDSIFIPEEINGEILTMAKDNNGKIYLGGDFTWHGQPKYLLILNADYTVATSPSISVNGKINRIKIDGNNMVFTGNFSEVNSAARISMAAYDLGSNQLLSFAPNPDGAVNDFAINNNQVIIGGQFNFIGGGIRSGLAIIGLNNTLQSFDAAVSGLVYSVAFKDSLLFIGGEFDSVQSVYKKNIASINLTTGNVRSIWPVTPDGAINSLCILNDDLYLGGAFYSINTNNYRSSLASVNVLTGALSTATDIALDAPVNKLDVVNGQVFVFGNFTTVNNANSRFVTAINAGGSVQNLPRANKAVNCALLDNGKILFGGSFSSIGGKIRKNILAFDANSGNIEDFNPDIDGEISDMLTVGNDLLIAGNFMNINTVSRTGIAIIDTLNGNTNIWDILSDGPINKVDLVGSTLFIAGKFNQVGDSSRNNIASVNMLTGLANPWNPGTDGEVKEMVRIGVNLFISGDFYQVNNTSRNHLASFDFSNNGMLRSWNPASDSTISFIRQSNNKLLCSGWFSSIGGSNISKLALLDTGNASAGVLAISFNGIPLSAYQEGNMLLLAGNISSNSNNSFLAFNMQSGMEINFPVKVKSGTVTRVAKYENYLLLSGNFILESELGKSNQAWINFNISTPTVQASNVVFGNISPISARISFTRGNGESRIVLVRPVTAVDTFPTNGISYIGNTVFGSGSPLGFTFATYVGTDTSFILSGLNSSTNYHVAVFEFNGFEMYTSYLTANAAVGNFTTTTAFAPPTISASAAAFSDVRVTTAKLKWTKGNGENRLVIIRENSPVNVTPSDSVQYFANAEFGSGSVIGTDNYVLYKGNGDSLDISGLKTGKTYYISIFEYNGPDLLSRYKLSTPATASTTTLSMAASPTMPATALLISAITGTEMTLTWTSGNGSSRIVIASENEAVQTMPENGTLYFSDNFFNGNSSYLSSNERVVYVGSSNTFTVKGLSPLTKYYFAVIEYNGANYTTTYLKLGYATGNATTKSGVLPPVTPTHNIQFTDRGSDYLNLKWTSGSGQKRLVVVKDKLSAGGFPTDGILYNANTIFGLGDTLSDGSFVIGADNLDSISVTGLTPNTNYYFAIYEYNESAMGATYLTDSFATATTVTLPNVGLGKINTDVFSVYPNPVSNNTLYLHAAGYKYNEDLTITVSDIRGKTIQTVEIKKGQTLFSQDLQLDLGGMNSGNYILRIQGVNTQQTLKFTIN